MKKISISDLESKMLEKQDRIHQVEIIAAFLLQRDKMTSSQKVYSSDDLLKKYKEIKKDTVDVPDNSFIAYLSLSAKEPWSRVYCNGRKQGYFYGEPLEQEDEETPIEKFEIEGISRKKLYEEDLYPYLVDWLSTSNDKAWNVSAARGMKKWGNPDVLAINVTSLPERNIVEITTIEAKRTYKNWRSDIFEAVAHTLFADKVYFAYVCKESEVEKIQKEMIPYAQKFRLGVLVFAIPDDEWGKVTSISSKYIHELVPAPLQQSNIQSKKLFLNKLGISTMDDLYNFNGIKKV